MAVPRESQRCAVSRFLDYRKYCNKMSIALCTEESVQPVIVQYRNKEEDWYLAHTTYDTYLHNITKRMGKKCIPSDCDTIENITFEIGK